MSSVSGISEATEYLSVPEVAAMSGISATWVRKDIRAGRLVAYKLVGPGQGGRQWGVPREEAEAYGRHRPGQRFVLNGRLYEVGRLTENGFIARPAHD